MEFESFKDTIEKAQKIIIFSHVNADGDTLGTMTALHLAIKNNFNKQAVMAASGTLPQIYMFLPETDKIKKTETMNPDEVYDLAIAVDIAAKDRMTAGVRIFDKAKVTMNLDHHKTNNNYGDINFVQANASCAGEVLFDILQALDLKIDKQTAEALYTAFMTDTGGFRYENTKAVTLQKAAKLIELGANPSLLARRCYESKPKAMVLLQSDCIMKAKFLENNKIAYTCVTNRDMEKFNAENDHTEGLAEALRRIDTTDVSFVLKEVDQNTTKASLRSKTIDVSVVAEAFGGGGHTFAAGCTIHKPINIAKDKMLEEIKKWI